MKLKTRKNVAMIPHVKTTLEKISAIAAALSAKLKGK